MRNEFKNDRRQPGRAGFTLVEMLVATGLVVLIMLLFAQMFGGVVSSMTQMQGIAQNDSKARIVEGTLRRDLKKMTFRQVSTGSVKGIVPLAPGDQVDINQRGYLYISENDPLDDTDDLIQFTIDVDITNRDSDRTKLLGKAVRLKLPDGDAADPELEDQLQNPIGDNFPIPSPNQPDADDGQVGNGVTTSRAAEVVYFLRNGNLYRRVMLLRDPVRPPAGESLYNEQPTLIIRDAAGSRVAELQYFSHESSPPFVGNVNYTGDVSPGSPNFWNDFDLSATRLWDTGSGNGANGSILHMNGYSSLNNSSGTANRPIAFPYHRFGFSPVQSGDASFGPFSARGASSVAGRSREFFGTTGTAAGATAEFMGRFLHEETSHPDFKFPGNLPTLADWQNPAVPLSVNEDGIVPALVGGSRAGEDLLMPNVESFDVKIWDQTYVEPLHIGGDGIIQPEDFNADDIRQTAGLFLDIGHDYGFDVNGDKATGGPASQALDLWGGSWSISNLQNMNPLYGPFAAINTAVAFPYPRMSLDVPQRNRNRVFDTWHPSYSHGIDVDLAGPPAAIERTNNNPPYRPLKFFTTLSVYDPSTGLLAQSQTSKNLHRTWTQLAIPGPVTLSRAPGDIYFPESSNGSIGYRVVRSGEAISNPANPSGPPISYFDFNGNGSIQGAVSNTQEPEWPTTVGATVVENGTDNDPSNDVVWEAFDNRVGIEMLQITIRYRDQQSGLSRQVTIRHSFVE